MLFPNTQVNTMTPGNITMNGSSLQWVMSFKHLGNQVSGALFEKEEIRLKQCNFISQVNGVLTRFNKAIKSVLMQVAYWCHYYGSQAWNLEDKYSKDSCVTWNKALRRRWELPANLHTIYLAWLIEGQHVFDSSLYRFSVVYIGI